MYLHIIIIVWAVVCLLLFLYIQALSWYFKDFLSIHLWFHHKDDPQTAWSNTPNKNTWSTFGHSVWADLFSWTWRIPAYITLATNLLHNLCLDFKQCWVLHCNQAPSEGPDWHMNWSLVILIFTVRLFNCWNAPALQWEEVWEH